MNQFNDENNFDENSKKGHKIISDKGRWHYDETKQILIEVNEWNKRYEMFRKNKISARPNMHEYIENLRKKIPNRNWELIRRKFIKMSKDVWGVDPTG